MSLPTTTGADPSELAAHLIDGQLALAVDENTHPTDQWALLAPPAPTQTRAYATAVLAREHEGLSPQDLEVLVDDRLNRGRALRTSAVARRICVTELALRAPVLDEDGMAAQRAHLADLSRYDHIHLRVLPYGHTQLLCHSFEVRNGRALVESLVGMVALPGEHSYFQARFERLWQASLPYTTWYRTRPDPQVTP